MSATPAHMDQVGSALLSYVHCHQPMITSKQAAQALETICDTS